MQGPAGAATTQNTSSTMAQHARARCTTPDGAGVVILACSPAGFDFAITISAMFSHYTNWFQQKIASIHENGLPLRVSLSSRTGLIASS